MLPVDVKCGEVLHVDVNYCEVLPVDVKCYQWM